MISEMDMGNNSCNHMCEEEEEESWDQETEAEEEL
jgi:hypothetical protein